MTTFRKFLLLFILIIYSFFLNPFTARADSLVSEELQAVRTQMEVMQKRLDQLEEKITVQQEKITTQERAKAAYEKRVHDLEAELAKQESMPAGQPGALQKARAQWTPQIGVIADTVFTLTSPKDDAEGANRLSLRELELVLGSNVDPLSRLDAVISFSDTEEPSLEEAYLTRFGLPWETTARLGKFKPKVGKVLGIHRDSLETVDEPLVIQRYFGVEGMSKSGVDFSKTLNLPWTVTHQVVLGILEGGNGEDGTAFGTTRRSPTLYTHLKNYIDLTDAAGLEGGLSYMAGAQGETPNFAVQILGADLTLTHQFNATKSLKWQNEVYHLNRRKTIDDLDGNLWGAYGLLDYRFHPQLSVGGRYDYVELIDHPLDTAHNADAGETGYLTFYQSEFVRWRLQYTHTRLATGKDNNTVYLQGTFAIGDHKHKLQ